MNEDIDLTNELRQLASRLPREAGANVESELVAAYRARQPRKKRRLGIYAGAAAVACIALIAGWDIKHHRAVVTDTVYDAPGFIPLPYLQSGVPVESAVVIRVEMRSSDLTSLGVAASAGPSTAKFKADLLVGQDGVPRAVRFVE